MPHINRIRVNNVKYNFGTQFYDDFMMRFSGKNTIYDLANGGGKSVLMLLLMQNLIPNCTLDEKQPLEKLFRTNEGSTTIHSLIEWTLSDVHIKNELKYMLTGFCARKAKDSGEEKQKNTAETEYFNYVIFYRSYNDNDIKNLPLIKDGERITYNGLKNYLKELEKKAPGLEVHIFDRKGDYQRFITGYGLYESHWEIVRGINKTEGHVRTYFETNYKTTRKVVEDLLIEEIIRKSFQNRYHSENEQDNMAKTLLDIKDQLIALSKKKEQLHHYDRQIEMIENFSERVGSIRQLFVGMESLEYELSKAYNTVVLMEEDRKREREKLADEKAFIVNEKNSLSRRVETAKVAKRQNELNMLKEKLGSYAEIIAGEKEEILALEKELKEKECGNDFLEYISYKAEYDKTKEMLDYALSDADTLTGELGSLTATWKKYIDKRNEILNGQMEQEKSILMKEEETVSEYEKNLNEDSNTIAVLEFRLKENEQKKEEAARISAEARNNSGVLIPSTAEREIEKLTEEIQKDKSEIEQLNNQYSEINHNIQGYTYEREKLLHERESIEKQITLCKEQNEQYETHAEDVKRISKIYGAKDLRELPEIIHRAVRDKVILIDELKKNRKKLAVNLEAKKNGKLFEESEDVKNVIDYIERYHGEKAVSGAEYLKEIDEEKARALMEKMPVLPYSIVVRQGFDEIASDEKIYDLNRSLSPVAVIREELLGKEEMPDDRNVIYLVNSEDILLDEDALKMIIKKCENELLELDGNIQRQEETLKVMEEDYRQVLAYMKIQDENDDVTEKLDNLLLLRKEKISALEMLEEQVLQWRESVGNISTELETAKKRVADNQSQKELLSEVYQYYRQADDIEKQSESVRKQLDAIKKNYNNLLSRKEALVRQKSLRKEKIESLRVQKTENEQEWTKVYAPYYISGSSEITDITPQELKARLDGVIETVTKENSGLKERQKLLQSYGKSMEKILQRIQYNGFDIEKLNREYEEGTLTENSVELLAAIKESGKNRQKKLEEIVKKEKEIASQCNKTEGAISHAIQVISEKYGYYREEEFGESDLNIFIEENEGMLKDYEKMIDADEEKLRVIEEEINGYSIVRHDIDSRMEMESIKLKDTTEAFEKGIDVAKKSMEILKKYESFRSDVSKRREDFIHEKQMLIDTMKYAGGDILAEEIRVNVSMPENFDETDRLIKMFGETTKCLELERDMVGKGIEDMEKIKQNFETQCLQNCLNIKTELERLPKMSKILLDGEHIPVISLKIPYKKEEEYMGAMSEYIDHIAQKADELSEVEDRIKYLKNQLSFKKLFSVIVNDMNGIKLNLYKRERIKEFSRYLPYEEAVGSTGQSQGIYIQFLIAVINYISSINSKNADASGLKKVVFLDNPFGAAKDVYIWEPIFKLLKTNNVQLVVPARGATPAITGKFDVNYVLGQKMAGKKQQTVVVDYFSNVENEEIEYTKIEYEQTSLF